MKTFSILLLFAFIGLSCARVSYLSQIARGLFDPHVDEDIPELKEFRHERTFSDEDDLDDVLRGLDEEFKRILELEKGGHRTRNRAPKKPSPTLPLNKTDCNCRLRATSRIVNGEEAVPNRYEKTTIFFL